MKLVRAVLASVCALAAAGPVRAETVSLRLTPGKTADNLFAFTIKAERQKDNQAGEYLAFHVAVKPNAAAGNGLRSGTLEVYDGKEFVSSCEVRPAEKDGERSYSFRIAAKYAAKSRFVFAELLGEFDGAYYWFHPADFIAPAPEPAGKPGPGAAADPVRGKFVAYWLTRDPPNPNAAEYGPAVLLTRVPLPELADYDPLFRAAAKRQGEDRPPLLDGIALTFETYQKDSIWNPDGRPLKRPRSVGPVRAAAREVTVDGTKYRYDDCSIPDVVRLLERPEGKKPLNRIHGPLTGAENTGRALMLLLKEQLAAEQKNSPAPAKGGPPVDLCRFPTLRGKVKTVLGHLNTYIPPKEGEPFQLSLKDLPKLTSLAFDPAKKSYTALPGPAVVESIRYYTNGAFASMRLVSNRDPKLGPGAVTIDIIAGGGKAQVWVIDRTDVTRGVVLIEGEYDGTFPDRPK